jgi:hypothetical protein
MCNLDQYTLAQLQAMTKTNIIAAWAQGRTYDEIAQREFDVAGQLIVLKIKTHTVLPDDVISQTKTKWLFHPNGAIHKIIHFDYDGAGTLLDRHTILHDSEGHAPPYRVDEGTMPENGNGGAAMRAQDVINIVGKAMTFTIISDEVDTSQPPVVSALGLKVPVMSKTLWRWIKGS